MTRRVLILDLKDDPALIAAYEAHHGPGAVPEAIVRSIHASGIEEMEIYRCGNRLVMMMETAAGFDPQAKAAADASDPAVIAWEELMDRYQQRLPWAPSSVKWLEAERIFVLPDPSGGSREATSSSSSSSSSSSGGP
jgi:L-rhamnose mutarotase